MQLHAQVVKLHWYCNRFGYYHLNSQFRFKALKIHAYTYKTTKPTITTVTIPQHAHTYIHMLEPICVCYVDTITHTCPKLITLICDNAPFTKCPVQIGH